MRSSPWTAASRCDRIALPPRHPADRLLLVTHVSRDPPPEISLPETSLPEDPPSDALLPEGVHLDLDPSVRNFAGGTVLTGGFPGRLVALSRNGAASLARLTGDRPLSEADRRLGRHLVSAGLAHPRIGTGPTGLDRRLTVVVPVRDRVAQLDRCLAALGGEVPVVVVDDGSHDRAAVAAVCAARGARLLRREESGGPGAARNAALDVVDSELVALVDSDCTVAPGWLDPLIGMFDDPALGAVAPRVRPRFGGPSRSALARFAAARSPLDMGSARGEVGPGRKVRYVPTAALILRRSAIGRFDPALEVGEDVDLVWRMVDAGWHVRLEPAAMVWHDEPTTWTAWLRRRFRYGTSAGPLARRHPGRLAPVELRAWPSAAVAAGLGRRPWATAGLVLASALLTARQVRGHGIPFARTVRWSAASAGWTLVGAGRALTLVAGPLLPLAGLAAARRRPSQAATWALVALAPPLVDWWQKRPALDPLRWSAAWLADDLAYGAGVWAGCLRSRSAGPLLPVLKAGRWESTAAPALDHDER